MALEGTVFSQQPETPAGLEGSVFAPQPEISSELPPAAPVPTLTSDALFDMQDYYIASGEMGQMLQPANVDAMGREIIENSKKATWGEMTGAIYKGFSWTAGMGAYGIDQMEMSGISPQWDASLDTHAYAQERHGDIYKRLLDEANDLPGSAQMFEDWMLSPNADVLDAKAKQIQDHLNYRKFLSEAGASNWIVGAVGGIGTDVLATLGVGMAVKGALTPAAIARMAELTKIAQLRQSVQSKRLLAFSEWGAIGAAEGGLATAAEALTNPDITAEDYIIAMGLGGVLGGGIGMAVSKLSDPSVARRITQKELQVAQEEMDARLAEMTVSSMGANEFRKFNRFDELKTIDTGKIPSIMDPLEEKVLSQIRHLRGGRRRMAGYTNRAARTGDKALQRATNVMNRIAETFAGAKGDLSGRTRTVEQAIDELYGLQLTAKNMMNKEIDTLNKELFGTGKFRTAVSNHQFTEFSSYNALSQKLMGKAVTHDEMKRWGDDLARALGRDARSVEGAANVKGGGKAAAVRENIRAELKGRGWEDAEVDRALASIDKIEKIGTAWSDAMFDRQVAAGLLKEEQRLPNYRPQNWNTTMIVNNESEFKLMLTRVFAGDPDENWVNEVLSKAGVVLREDAETGATTPLRIDVENGQTFHSFSQEHPEMALDLARKWQEEHQDAVLARHRDLIDATNLSLGVFRKSLGEEKIAENEAKIARLDRLVEKHARTVDKYEEAWRTSKAKSDYASAQRAQQHLDRALADREKALQLKRQYEAGAGAITAEGVTVSSRKVEELQALLQKRGQLAKADKKTLEKQIKQVQAAIRAYDKKAAQKLINERVEDAYRMFRDGRSQFGFIPDNVRAGSKHWKSREIELNDFGWEPGVRKFLQENTDWNMSSYVNTSGRKLALVENLAPLVGGYNGSFDNFMTDVRNYMLAGYEEELAKGVASEARKKRIAKDKAVMNEYFDDIMNEVMRLYVLKQGSISGPIISTLQSAATASSLGFMLAAMLQDVATVVMAGSRTATGFKNLLRNLDPVFEEMEAKGYAFEALTARGQDAFEARIFSNRADTDAIINDAEGTWMRKMSRTADSVAHLSGYATFMHQWNKKFMQTFGFDIVKQMDEDLSKYADLDIDMKSFYSRKGISEAEAKEIMVRLNRGDVDTFDNGNLRIPDREKWLADERGAYLYQKYWDAVRSAGKEAILDPGISDRPFWAHHPYGRLVFQFSSFSYTMANKFFLPMVQAGLDGKNMQVAAAVAATLTFAALGDAWRNYARGPETWNEYKNDWETRPHTIFKRMYQRSNFVFGLQPVATDAFAANFGENVNTIGRDLLGVDGDLIDTRWSKLRQGQNTWGAVGGPVGGFIGKGERIKGAYDAGNFEKGNRLLLQALPGTNTIAWATMWQLADDIGLMGE